MPRVASLLALLVALLLLPSVADARYGVRIGVGDQNVELFDQPSFQAAEIKRVRYFIPWNAIRDRAELRRADAYVQRARLAGISVTLHITTEDLRAGRGHLPTPSGYRSVVGRLVRHFRPMGVREWGVWNEANHPSQPTSRSPKRAAQYYEVMRRICRGCTIVALDVLDLSDVATYVDRFYRALPPSARRAARLVGIHNYSDVNRRRTVGTRTIVAAVRKHARARFWLTETGGIVALGRTFRCSPKRAADRTRYLFALLRRYDHVVDRAYVYNWVGTGCSTRMDTGMVNADGTPRPAYHVFVSGLKQLRR